MSKQITGVELPAKTKPQQFANARYNPLVREKQNRNGKKNRPDVFLARHEGIAHTKTADIKAFITDISATLC